MLGWHDDGVKESLDGVVWCGGVGWGVVWTWSSSNSALPVTLVHPFSVKSDEKIIKNHKMKLF
jgi:hypothetical protein